MRNRTEETMKKLNLTATQRTAWEKVSKEQREAMQPLRKKFEGKRPDMQTMMKEMKPILDKFQPKFEKILDAKQKVTYRKMLEERAKRFQHGGAPGAGGAAGKGGKGGGL